jgi:hypothetical protein
MSRTLRIIVPAIAGVLAATAFANAQTAGTPAPQQPPQGRHQPSSPETMQRMQDGRIAMITTTLKLTDAQKKLWEPVEAQIRARGAARAKAMQDRLATQQPGGAQPGLTDRMERRAKMQAERAEQEKTYLAALKPFYAALTDEQKVLADRLLGGMQGGHGRFAGRHHGHGQGGMGGRTL